jgi:N4-gp56 family major capsid protein
MSDMLELTAIDNVVVEALKLLGRQGGATLDTVVRNILHTGTNVMYCPKIGADGAETAVTSRTNLDNTCKLTVKVIQKAVAKLRAQNAPTISGKYVAIIHPYAAYDLMRDKEWIDAHKYAQPENLYTGEIGKLAGVRFVETTEAKIVAPEPICGILKNRMMLETALDANGSTKVCPAVTHCLFLIDNHKVRAVKIVYITCGRINCK